MKDAERPRVHDRHDQEPALRCPRCDSPHTKFCYYNNYSRSQPRHFCKACKRYWTRGGTLRNVPVGGGIRKNKRAPRPPPPPPAAVAVAVPGASGSNSSSSLDRSLAFQGNFPSSGRPLQDQIDALGYPWVVPFEDHAGVDLHQLRQLHRPDRGLSFPGEEADGYGCSLSYWEEDGSRNYCDSSSMQAGAAEATMFQNDLLWPPLAPPQPECGADHTSSSGLVLRR